jgi:hypothetical protein
VGKVGSPDGKLDQDRCQVIYAEVQLLSTSRRLLSPSRPLLSTLTMLLKARIGHVGKKWKVCNHRDRLRWPHLLIRTEPRNGYPPWQF